MPCDCPCHDVVTPEVLICPKCQPEPVWDPIEEKWVAAVWNEELMRWLHPVTQVIEPVGIESAEEFGRM